jgi:prepilin-type N-terminal cleavage/methylation domain-containing protein
MRQIPLRCPTEQSSGTRLRGVTAIELLIVLALIGILAGFALPRINFGQFQADAGARLVRITLQGAQRMAITRQYDVVVSFDTANGRLRVLEDRNDNEQVDPGERATWHPLEDGVHFAVPPAPADGTPATAPVVGSNLRSVDGMPSVIFRRDGAASSTVTAYLTAKQANPNDFRAVRVVQSTGRTEWLRYLDGRWKRVSL